MGSLSFCLDWFEGLVPDGRSGQGSLRRSELAFEGTSGWRGSLNLRWAERRAN